MIVMSEWNGGPGSAGQFDGRGGHVGGGGGVGHAPPAGAPQYHPHHHPLAAAAGVSAQCQFLNDSNLLMNHPLAMFIITFVNDPSKM